jgi:hypothetical protein
MCDPGDLESLRRFYEASVSTLDERVAVTRADDKKLPYLRRECYGT